MTQAELLRYLADALEALGTDYMISGSHASIYYGEPRLTRDVDVIVALRVDHLPALLSRFPADEYYVDDAAAREAIRTSGQFNIIHPSSGLKIDIYVNPDTPYDRTRLARRQRLPLVPGVSAFFARPEDIILYKLLYQQQVESGMHVRDIVGIIRVSGAELDEHYIRHWAEQLGVRTAWDRIRKQAE
jgi:hypothetical protein